MLKLLKEDWPAEKLAQIFAGTKDSAANRAESVSVEQFAFRLTQEVGWGV